MSEGKQDKAAETEPDETEAHRARLGSPTEEPHDVEAHAHRWGRDEDRPTEKPTGADAPRMASTRPRHYSTRAGRTA